MLAKISAAIAVFRFLFEVSKEIMELVQLVEEKDQGEGNGEEKKNAVLSIIEKMYDAAESFTDLPIEKDTVLKFADNVIDIVVQLFNMIGFFRK